MRRLIFLIITIFAALYISAQAPQAFSYQAVVRDAQNELLINRTVGVKVSILKDAANGAEVYSETHQPVTNDNGLVTLQVGAGTTSDDFSTIEWGSGTYFIETEFDLDGGTNYTISSVSQLLSVPYALYAGSVPKLEELKEEMDEIKNTMYAGGYVEDIDGNRYNTVKIGSQVWMAENLKVTHYPDGTEIPLIEDYNSWGDLENNDTDDAYCWYNNDITNKDTYGALYTYAAAIGDNWQKDISESQGVCPDGWHLPTDNEWKELEIYLGMSQAEVDKEAIRGGNEGSRLADGKELWRNGLLIQNEDFGISGFKALPAGGRAVDTASGNFGGEGVHTVWWTATNYFIEQAYGRNIYYGQSTINRFKDYYKCYGLSVRCVKD